MLAAFFCFIVVTNIVVVAQTYSRNKRRKSNMNIFIMQLALAGERSVCSSFPNTLCLPYSCLIDCVSVVDVCLTV